MVSLYGIFKALVGAAACSRTAAITSHSHADGGDQFFATAHRNTEVMRKLARHLPGPKNICLVNVFMPHDAPFANLSESNHIAYARRHGYRYYGFRERLSGHAFVNPSRGSLADRLGGGLTWQKLSALAAVADDFSAEDLPFCRWLMWLDADTVVTDLRRSVDGILRRYADGGAGVDAYLVIAQDDCIAPGAAINSGVMLIRNSWEGRALIMGAAKLFDKYKDGPLTDQNAIYEYISGRDARQNDPAQANVLPQQLRVGVVVTPQRVMNSFFWPDLPETAKWQTCDFIGHIPGGTVQQRVDGIHAMLAAPCRGKDQGLLAARAGV